MTKRFVIAHSDLFENTTKILFVQGEDAFKVLKEYTLGAGYELCDEYTTEGLKDLFWSGDQIVEIAEVPE